MLTHTRRTVSDLCPWRVGARPTRQLPSNRIYPRCQDPITRNQNDGDCYCQIGFFASAPHGAESPSRNSTAPLRVSGTHPWTHPKVHNAFSPQQSKPPPNPSKATTTHFENLHYYSKTPFGQKSNFSILRWMHALVVDNLLFSSTML
jgi:hypothetical protein